MVRFDAYTATMKGPKPDDLMGILIDQVGLGASFYASKGFHTFGNRLAVKDSGGHEVGAVQYGGFQGERVMFEVKGEVTPKAVEALRSRFEHRVTRVDSCADFDAPDAFERLLGACTEVKRDHKIYGSKDGDWEDHPEMGRTLYMGAKTSPVRMRLYEKGKQPEYLHLNKPDWCRIEAQVRPKSPEAKENFSKLSATEVWGAGRWTRDLAAKVLLAHVDPHAAGTVYRLSDHDRALRAMCKQYGAHLLELLADTGSWECAGLTIGEIIKEQAKGR